MGGSKLQQQSHPLAVHSLSDSQLDQGRPYMAIATNSFPDTNYERAMALAMAVASTSLNCVVWEWQRDDGGYSPYVPETSSQIETAYSSGAPSLIMADYTVHFANMIQKKNNTGYERPIQRTTLQLPASTDVKAYWTWNDRGRNFVLYNIQPMVDIELGHQQGDSSVDLSTCPSRLPYTIDFHAMEQIRHGYGTRRKVQRHPLTASMQSYLRIHTGSTSGVSITTASSSASAVITGPGFSMGSSLPPAKSRPKPKSSPPSKGRRRVKKSSGGGATSSGAISNSADSEITPYARKIRTVKQEDDGPCPICMNQLSEQSGFEDEELHEPMPPVPYAPPLDVYKLKKCEHMMHRACLLMYTKSSGSKSGFQCPTCKKVYGIKTGNMPDGTMTVRKQRYTLPGHDGHGSIEITYNFTAGVHNGQHYRTNGFPRICYLPDSPKGQQVLRLLKIAWDRKLTFTVGTSVTTGSSDTVVWNEIHHKTENTSNHSGHGYPDSNYLDNVLMELAAQGVEDGSDTDSDTIIVSSDSDSDL